MNYKWHNKKCFCRDGHPTPPQSTIQDHAYFSAGPTHKVFRYFQRIEFPRLDRRKAHPLLETFFGVRGIPYVREKFPLSQTTSHRSHEWCQARANNSAKDSDLIQTAYLRGRDIKMWRSDVPSQIPELLLLVFHRWIEDILHSRIQGIWMSLKELCFGYPKRTLFRDS